jgi:PAS domain S-box-containing protein
MSGLSSHEPPPRGENPARPPAFDELIVAAASCGILVFDATGQCRQANEAAAETAGGTVSALLGQNFRELKSWQECGMRRLAEEVLATGIAQAAEFHSVTTFGREMWVSCRFSRFAKDGQPHLLLIVTDVTERKSLEAQFRQAQKMESVGRLAGGIAHDFNNLMTIISGYSEMLLNDAPAGHPMRDYLLEIKKAGERAVALTHQLLAYSRRQILTPDLLDLNALLKDSESVLRRLLGEDVDLTLVPAPGLGRVRIDAAQLEQALMNLAINARDAMPQGGKLTIETASVRLDEAFCRLHPEVKPGPYVLVAVSDTGTGMDAMTKAQVFEPFFTTKEQGKGTGLGLAMVFGFIKQSGGHVSVYSEPGLGSVFKIYLPQAGVPEPVAEPGVGDALTVGGETILLVEDEEDLRRLARQILTLHGYTVLAAMNGQEALRLAEAHPGPIDLLVSDVVMPGMDGRQLAARIAARRPGLKVLFMSGYTDDAVLRHGILASDAAFLQKPFALEALPLRVRRALGG